MGTGTQGGLGDGRGQTDDGRNYATTLPPTYKLDLSEVSRLEGCGRLLDAERICRHFSEQALRLVGFAGDLGLDESLFTLTPEEK